MSIIESLMKMSLLLPLVITLNRHVNFGKSFNKWEQCQNKQLASLVLQTKIDFFQLRKSCLISKEPINQFDIAIFLFYYHINVQVINVTPNYDISTEILSRIIKVS